MEVVVARMTDPGHVNRFRLENLLNQHPSFSCKVFSGKVNVHILIKNGIRQPLRLTFDIFLLYKIVVLQGSFCHFLINKP